MLLAIWALAPESTYQSPEPGGVSDMVLKLLARDAVSKDPPCMGFHGWHGAGAMAAGGCP